LSQLLSEVTVTSCSYSQMFNLAAKRHTLKFIIKTITNVLLILTVKRFKNSSIFDEVIRPTKSAKCFYHFVYSIKSKAWLYTIYKVAYNYSLITVCAWG